MEFYKLNYAGEDKIISREQRIFADTMLLPPYFDDMNILKSYVIDVNSTVPGFTAYMALYTGTTITALDTYIKAFPDYDELKPYSIDNTFSITTKSTAPRLKIKFFLDILYVQDTDKDEEFYYRIGKYYELEHGEQVQLFNSDGFYNFVYECSENDGNGVFTCTISAGERVNRQITLYISSVVFEDTFYNPVGGWLNPDNPDNLIDKIEDEKNTGLPPGAHEDDLLAYNTEPKWKTPADVTKTLTKATKDDFGVVKVDDDTIKASGGVISVPHASNTQFGAVKTDGTTIVSNAGILTVVGGGGGGGIDWSLSEQDTGKKWVDGKSVFQRSYTNVTNGQIILTGVDKIVFQSGMASTSATQQMPFPISNAGVQWCWTELNTVTHEVKINMGGFVAPNNFTIQYTKL